MIKRKKQKKVDFLLENEHYRRLHLYLYLLSISVIAIIYLLIVFLFSSYSNYLITGVVSVLIGLFLVFNRDKLVKFISDKLHDNKIQKTKKQNKQGLKNTLSRITPKPKRDIKLSIKETGFKSKVASLKTKMNSKKNTKNSQEYIEIK